MRQAWVMKLKPGNEAIYNFRWKETGGPAVTAPTRKGFGSILLRRLAQGFDTSSRLDFLPEGLLFEVSMPLKMITPNRSFLTVAGRSAAA